MSVKWGRGLGDSAEESPLFSPHVCCFTEGFARACPDPLGTNYCCCSVDEDVLFCCFCFFCAFVPFASPCASAPLNPPMPASLPQFPPGGRKSVLGAISIRPSGHMEIDLLPCLPQNLATTPVPLPPFPSARGWGVAR